MEEPEARLQGFIAKFDDDSQALIRDVRDVLKALLAGTTELVWDNYSFLVIGYSPTERPSDYIVSIAASAAGVSLSFNRGAELSDPDGILLGSSKVNRFIRLPAAAVLADPKVAGIIQTAMEASRVARPWTSEGKLVIRSVSAKQRPRRRSSTGDRS